MFNPELFGRARHVDGNVFFHFVELELIEQVVRDEFRWLIQGKSQGWVLKVTLDFRQARRGIDDDRVLAVFLRY